MCPQFNPITSIKVWPDHGWPSQWEGQSSFLAILLLLRLGLANYSRIMSYKWFWLISSNPLETSWCADAWEFERLSPVGSFEERPQKVSPLPVFAPFSFLSFYRWSQDITASVTSSHDLCLIILSSLQPRPFLPFAAAENHNNKKERNLHHSQGAPQQVLLHLGHQLVILVSVSAKCSTKVIGRSWKKILVPCEYSSSRSPV